MGFSLNPAVMPTELKVEVIGLLADAGMRHIQVTSFVHPEKIPQMADAEDLLRRLPRRDGCRLQWPGPEPPWCGAGPCGRTAGDRSLLFGLGHPQP